MTFLTPLLAGIAAAITIPALLILYFLKLRRREVEVSTTLLWKKAIEDLQANAPFQRLRRNILLFLQLLALLAALFALAQPQIRANLAPGGKHIIMIDRSASMQATDGVPAKSDDRTTRLQAAKKAAAELVDSLREPNIFGGAGDEAMLVAFDLVGERLVSFTNNKAELKRAIESITPVDSPTRLGDAFTLAKAYSRPAVLVEDKGIVAGGPGAMLHLFSDGVLSDAAQVRPEVEDTVTYHAIGSPDSWNIGITALRADRSYERPDSVSIFVGLSSTSTRPQKVDVQLTVEGVNPAIREVTLPPATRSATSGDSKDAPASSVLTPSSAGVVFTIDRPTGGVGTIRLRFPEPPAGERGDVLAVDDIGYIVLPPARRLSVALVSDGNLVLQGMLTDNPAESMAAFNLARAVPLIATSQATAFLASKDAEQFDVIIFDGWLPTARDKDGRDHPAVPPGRSLVLGKVPPPPLGLISKGNGDPAVMLNWKRDHAVLRGVSLEPLVIDPGIITEEDKNAPVTVLAQSSVGPAIIEVSDVDRRAIITTFPLLKSNWPFDISLPLFIGKCFDYLARGGGADTTTTLQPGGTLSQRLPRDASKVSVTLPDSTAVSLLPSAAGDVNYAPISTCGIYTVSWLGSVGPTDVLVDGRARRAAAANLLDSTESDVATRQELSLASKAVKATDAGKGPGTLLLWPWLLVLGLLVLMVEWWVYNRKVSL